MDVSSLFKHQIPLNGHKFPFIFFLLFEFNIIYHNWWYLMIFFMFLIMIYVLCNTYFKSIEVFLTIKIFKGEQNKIIGKKKTNLDFYR